MVKHKNHQPAGAFKVRGGINLVSQLGRAERERGLIGASTGNHGQSIAYAARLFGVPRRSACRRAPTRRRPRRFAGSAPRDLHGRDFDEAREYCERARPRAGRRYVHSGNEPLLIAGVGTGTLEILEQEPGIDVVVVPIGGGSGAAGACIARRRRPVDRGDRRAVGGCSGCVRSWKERRPVEDEMETFAEGLATRDAFELPQRILRRLLDDFVLVSDDEIRAAQLRMIEGTRNLIEAAGASPLAAALDSRRSSPASASHSSQRRQRQPRPASRAARGAGNSTNRLTNDRTPSYLFNQSVERG